MADRITIELDVQAVTRRLDEILRALGPDGLRGALAEMGEDLVESTKMRFANSRGPDGQRWAPNSMATLMGVLEGSKGNLRKDGRVNKKGATRIANKKPLVASGLLQDTIAYQVDGAELFVGTNRFAGQWDGGAAVHQFGRKDGSIPARPFLGADAADVQRMLDVLEHYLAP